ncbi:MAG: YqjK-like family protein [Gallionellaceae bacterium]|nr:YqjK-like family protein [Gallionellaceae bacterium]
MKDRLADIALRRRLLLEKIGVQRTLVADIAVQWQRPLALANTGLKAVRLVSRHPALVTGVATAVLTLRHGGIMAFAKGGWRLLFLYPSAIFFGLKYLASAISLPGETRDGETAAEPTTPVEKS